MRWRLIFSAILIGLAFSLVGVYALTLTTVSVSGTVLDELGRPAAGATVRVQTTSNATTSGSDGSFTLAGLTEGVTVTVTAWREGYQPIGATVVPPQASVVITLKPHWAGDDPTYAWITSYPDPEASLGCGHCMVAFDEWKLDAHSQSAVNPRFFTMYNGTDTTGRPNVAPGYKLDFPNTAGACANCHAPAAAVNKPFTADMNTLTGVEREGVLCDLCHKIGAAYLNPASGRPYQNVPGMMSYRLYRPSATTQIFFGTFDDVTRRVSYLALEKRSQFCAACHQFSFWGTPIYESFREWQESAYATQNIHCQACHMPTNGMPYFTFPEKGGLIRDPALMATHLQRGATDIALLQNTVTLQLGTARAGGVVQATVVINNTGAGHHVPTDFPGRHLILTVTATDSGGQPLAQVSGPTVPAWGGAEAGLPGKAFAKVLRDLNTGEQPTAAYWNPTVIVSDNRLPAFAIDTTVYEFAAPPSGAVNVQARLIFRRAFQALLDAKRWDMSDIEMEQETVSVP
jgi:nitrate/TMAO reductase-like tetraheme cytochrome c subunit